MADHRDILSANAGLRTVLRVLGPVLVLAGVALVAVAMVDFFASFNSVQPPRRFGYLFAGAPLIGLGIWMARWGYLGVAARYVAGEVAPVATEVVEYLAEEGKDTTKTVARMVTQGIAEGLQVGSPQKRCPKCEASNDPQASFCSSCGTALRKETLCPGCGHANRELARFCDSCGRRLA